MNFFMPAPFRLSPPERRELKRMSRSQGGRADEVRRARIILGLAGGQSLAGVSRSQASSVNTVKIWRERFLEGRISGLWGRHPGKAVAPGTERLEARIINWTLHRKPSDGSTHWSSRKLAAALGLSHMRVARVWTKAGLQPLRRRHYMTIDDPDLSPRAPQPLVSSPSPRPTPPSFVSMKRLPFRLSIGSIRSCLCRRAAPSAMGLNISGMALFRYMPPSRSPVGKLWAKRLCATPAPSSSPFWPTWSPRNPRESKSTSSPTTFRRTKTKAVTEFLALHPIVQL